MMTPLEKLYDGLMRLPIVCFEMVFLVREAQGIRQLVAAHPYIGDDWSFVATLFARLSVVAFIVVLIVLHLGRLRPVRKFSNWLPKLAALAGVLLSYLILLTPRAPADPVWDGLSAGVTITGAVLAMLAALDLGRSVSVMPEARRLVVEGLYRRIRHPLYLAQEIATLGFFLQFRSWQAAFIVLVHFTIQLRRMAWEEQILAEAFADYAPYRRRSWRLVPGVY